MSEPVRTETPGPAATAPPARPRLAAPSEHPKAPRPYRMSIAERLYLPLLGGLAVTLRHFLRNLIHGRKVTISYPEQRRQYSHRFRGHHILTTRPDGSARCVACFLCATNCPAECIHIEAGEHPDVNIEKYPVRFEIDMLRCVFCGYCVDACPEEAIIMSNNYDMAYFSRAQSIVGKNDLMKPFTYDEKRLGYRPYYPEEQGPAVVQSATGRGAPAERSEAVGQPQRDRMRRQAFDVVEMAKQRADSPPSSPSSR